jgi:hypothetical protein
MGSPNSSDARLYYRCAFQRQEDAQILLRADHGAGAVYLAGYAVECILKALVLISVPAGIRAQTMQSFRGGKAHDYEWLRTMYLTNGGARFPREITEQFTLVNDWSTDLRYTPRTVRYDEAAEFLAAAKTIMDWADGRL